MSPRPTPGRRGELITHHSPLITRGGEVSMVKLEVEVNGEVQEVPVQPYETLLEALREEIGLTGAKEGCGTGDCGCCTVILDGQPVTSCLVLALQADGRIVRT